jgi:hypothetical protein
MASTDNEIINARERPLSSDINDAQALLGRFFADALQWMTSTNNSTGSAVRSGVFGGLGVTANGSNVNVSAGMLGQYSAALSPTPGVLDSTFRIGRLGSTQSIAMPSPGTTTYYVIEAQMSSVTTATESRDVLDSGTGIFAATLVPKIVEKQVTFQLVVGTAGGAIPAPTGGDWVPIAVVRRPGGGGSVVQSDIFDVRPFWDGTGENSLNRDRSSIGMFAQVVTTSGTVGVLPVTLGTTQAGYYNGQSVYVQGTIADIGLARYKEAGSAAFASGSMWHIYLCQWSGIAPRGVYNDISPEGVSGIIVLSQTPPVVTGGTHYASNAISLPLPWGGSSPATQCAYVASVVRGSAGWVGQQPINGGRGVIYTMAVSPTPLNLAFGLINLAPAGTDFNHGFLVPAVARSVELYVQLSPTGTPTYPVVAISPKIRVGSGATGRDVWRQNQLYFRDVNEHYYEEIVTLPWQEVLATGFPGVNYSVASVTAPNTVNNLVFLTTLNGYTL